MDAVMELMRLSYCRGTTWLAMSVEIL